MHIKIERILKEFKEEIQTLYGSRLKTILLYGSWARGNAGEDSDIDVVVVLKGDVTPGREIEKNPGRTIRKRMLRVATQYCLNGN